MFLLKLIAAIAYVGLGLPDAMLGIAWPGMRAEFEVPLDRLGLILASTFSGYLVSSTLAHWMARHLGIGLLLVASSSLMTLVVLGFALTNYFPILVLIGFFGGIGGGAIDASMNSFTAHRFSLRMINWLHGCWGIGAFCGPLLMTAVLVNGSSWRVGYGIVAVLLAINAILLFQTRWHWSYEEASPNTLSTNPYWLDVIRDRQVVGQCCLFFVYTGIESTVGQLLFTFWTEGTGLNEGLAGAAITAYWLAFTLSRFGIGALSVRWDGKQILNASALISIFLATIILIPNMNYLGLSAVALLGASIAPIFPTWIGITPRTVEPNYASAAIGYQVASAAIGIALIPWTIALISRMTTLHAIPVSLFVLVLMFLALQHRLLKRI